MKWILAIIAVMAFGCETRVEKRRARKPAKPIMLIGYKECSGGAEMRIFTVWDFKDRNVGCNPYKGSTRRAKAAVAAYSRNHKVVSVRAIYDPEYAELVHMEVVRCAETKAQP
jgi:hypothetical protein